MKKFFNVVRIGFATIIVAVLGLSTIVVPVAAQAPLPEANQTICHDYSEKSGNIAAWNDPQWQACFIAGYVNAVFSAAKPLPAELPASIQEALDKGLFLQLTEPWRSGCDNSLKHPACSIGFIKLFGQYETLKAFQAKGEFTQADVLKVGPWTDGSLWMTLDYVQVSSGRGFLSAKDAELFCSGSLGLAFANDGEYQLPSKNPCPDTVPTKFFLRERWNGGCIGNVLPNAACNVGEVLVYDSWDELLENTIGPGWNRGSVFANHKKLMKMSAIVVNNTTIKTPEASNQQASVTPAATQMSSATIASTATKVASTATQATQISPTTTSMATKPAATQMSSATIASTATKVASTATQATQISPTTTSMATKPAAALTVPATATTVTLSELVKTQEAAVATTKKGGFPWLPLAFAAAFLVLIVLGIFIWWAIKSSRKNAVKQDSQESYGDFDESKEEGNEGRGNSVITLHPIDENKGFSTGIVNDEEFPNTIGIVNDEESPSAVQNQKDEFPDWLKGIRNDQLEQSSATNPEFEPPVWLKNHQFSTENQSDASQLASEESLGENQEPPVVEEQHSIDAFLDGLNDGNPAPAENQPDASQPVSEESLGENQEPIDASQPESLDEENGLEEIQESHPVEQRSSKNSRRKNKRRK